jgi:hypothetical protein
LKRKNYNSFKPKKLFFFILPFIMARTKQVPRKSSSMCGKKVYPSPSSNNSQVKVLNKKTKAVVKKACVQASQSVPIVFELMEPLTKKELRKRRADLDKLESENKVK